MALSEILKQLQGNRTDYEIGLAYAKLKDGAIPERRDKYLKSCQLMINNPDGAQYGNLKRLFQVLGVDIETAIAIAASQVKPQE